ncbi:MAG TPA: hypothetical protein PK364_08045 [Synergistaceae bacterium]|nr:hypothetical protein [Synergistaceae bacterium]HPJ26690.1 hypothetical protein [Synergistaceae bacterium]HPQ37838.1 hypothetical protein [Synergistaceae bacterium]
MSDVSQREWRFYLDDDALWSIIQDDVPELLPLLKAFKNGVR